MLRKIMFYKWKSYSFVTSVFFLSPFQIAIYNKWAYKNLVQFSTSCNIWNVFWHLKKKKNIFQIKIFPKLKYWFQSKSLISFLLYPLSVQWLSDSFRIGVRWVLKKKSADKIHEMIFHENSIRLFGYIF